MRNTRRTTRRVGPPAARRPRHQAPFPAAARWWRRRRVPSAPPLRSMGGATAECHQGRAGRPWCQPSLRCRCQAGAPRAVCWVTVCTQCLPAVAALQPVLAAPRPHPIHPRPSLPCPRAPLPCPRAPPSFAPAPLTPLPPRPSLPCPRACVGAAPLRVAARVGDSVHPQVTHIRDAQLPGSRRLQRLSRRLCSRERGGVGGTSPRVAGLSLDCLHCV